MTELSTSLDRWSKRLIFLCLHLLVVVTPFLFTWFNEELFEFNKMLFVYAVVAILTGAWAVQMILKRKIIWRRSVLDIPVAIFVLSQVLSTIFSLHPRTSWLGYYTRFHGGLLSTLAYTAIYGVVSSYCRWRDLRALLRSAVLAGVGVALYAIPEHFGYSPSCVLIDGQLSTDCWAESTNPRHRIFGTFGQPNWLAAYLLFLIPVATAFASEHALQLYRHLQKKSRTIPWSTIWRLVAWLAAVGVFVAALWYTKSRSGLLGLGGSIMVAGGLKLGWLAVHRQWRLLQMAGVGIVAVLALVVVGLRPQERLADLSSLSCFLNPSQTLPQLLDEAAAEASAANRLESGGTDSGYIRCVVWHGAVQVWRRYPLLGSGVETFAYSYYLDRPAAHNLVSEWDFLYNKAHNEFLNYLATTGLVGLGAYIALLGVFLWLCTRAVWARSTPQSLEEILMLGALATAVVGVSISNFFGFSTVMGGVLLFIFLAAGASLTRHEKSRHALTDRGVPDHLATGQWLGLGAVLLAMGYALLTVSNWWSADHLYSSGKSYLQNGYVIEGLTRLENAALQSPSEGLFTDELATVYAQLAVSLAEQNDASAAAELAQVAELTSDRALWLNPNHLNFWKSRAQVFITLAELDPQYLDQAITTLRSATTLAPTDAKLRYNLGRVLAAVGRTEEARLELETALELRPLYGDAEAALTTLTLPPENP